MWTNIFLMYDIDTATQHREAQQHEVLFLFSAEEVANRAVQENPTQLVIICRITRLPSEDSRF